MLTSLALAQGIEKVDKAGFRVESEVRACACYFSRGVSDVRARVRGAPS